MVFIDWRGSARRLSSHAQPIRLFGITLLLATVGDLLLREALYSFTTLSLDVLTAALRSTYGLAAISCLCLALACWMRLLKQHQLSFFYPLWGLMVLFVLLANVLLAGLAVNLWMLLGAGLMLFGAAVIMRGGHSV